MVNASSNICPTEVAREVIAALAASGKHEYIAVLSRKVLLSSAILMCPMDLADLRLCSPYTNAVSSSSPSVKSCSRPGRQPQTPARGSRRSHHAMPRRLLLLNRQTRHLAAHPQDRHSPQLHPAHLGLAGQQPVPKDPHRRMHQSRGEEVCALRMGKVSSRPSSSISDMLAC